MRQAFMQRPIAALAFAASALKITSGRSATRSRKPSLLDILRPTLFQILPQLLEVGFEIMEGASDTPPLASVPM